MAGNIIDRLRAIREIGVPEDMPPGQARSIRITNSGVAALIIILLGFNVAIHLTADEVDIANYFGYAGALILSLVLFLNHKKHYTAARVIFCLALYFLVAAVSMTIVNTLRVYLLLIGLTASTFIIFPKTETRLMMAMVALSIVLYHVRLLQDYYIDPAVTAPGPERQALLNIIFEYFLYVFIILLAYIGRLGTIRAEERLLDEREKVTRLSDKLKAYLPRQLVDSLAEGGRDAHPDYRRRRLTVFFSDVQGFTKWTDRLEPEEVREILNHYLSEMSAIAHKWGGTIDKFIGDALMVFFGDPEFTDDRDHALRCVRMAMEMQQRMRSLRNEWRDVGHQEPLRIRIGINTGYATVGAFGSDDRLNYTALGSAVNLAARLETACAPDRITISHTTYSLIKDEIDCEEKGEIEVKGFAEPVKIYQVLGVQ